MQREIFDTLKEGDRVLILSVAFKVPRVTCTPKYFENGIMRELQVGDEVEILLVDVSLIGRSFVVYKLKDMADSGQSLSITVYGKPLSNVSYFFIDEVDVEKVEKKAAAKCVCTMQVLMRTGCMCGHIVRRFG